MYLIFLIFGIILFLLINNNDTFIVGVPFVKVFPPTDTSQYRVVNMDVPEPEPQDVEPIFDEYVTDDTYTQMEALAQAGQNPLHVFNPSEGEEPPSPNANDHILDTFFAQQFVQKDIHQAMISNFILIQVSLMLDFLKITYQQLINIGLITAQQALTEISLRPDMLNRSRATIVGHIAGRRSLPRECASIIIAEIPLDERGVRQHSLDYVTHQYNSGNFDLNRLRRQFNPDEYIDFLTRLLLNSGRVRMLGSRLGSFTSDNLFELSRNIRSNIFPERTSVTQSFAEARRNNIVTPITVEMPSRHTVFRNNYYLIANFYIYISPLIRNYDIVTAVKLILEYFQTLSWLAEVRERKISVMTTQNEESLSGLDWNYPNIEYYVWLLQNNYLGENSTYDINFIIDRYIDHTHSSYDSVLGDRFLQRLLDWYYAQRDKTLQERADAIESGSDYDETLDRHWLYFGSGTDAINRLRVHLLMEVDPREPESYNFYVFLYGIIDVLYEMFNSPG